MHSERGAGSKSHAFRARSKQDGIDGRRENLSRTCPSCGRLWRRRDEVAKASRYGADTVLQVGKAPDADPILVEILYSIRLPLYPHLEISVHSEPSSDLAHDLLIADLDLAIITNPAKNPKLTMNKLVETPLHIVLPREHPLSSKASVKLFDLRNEGWIVFQKRLHPILYDRIMKRTHDEGFEPRRLDHILYADEAEHMLTAAPERCIPDDGKRDEAQRRSVGCEAAR